MAQALLPVHYAWNASARATGRSACATAPPIRAPALDGHAKTAPDTGSDDEPRRCSGEFTSPQAALGRLENGGVNPPLRKGFSIGKWPLGDASARPLMGGMGGDTPMHRGVQCMECISPSHRQECLCHHATDQSTRVGWPCESRSGRTALIPAAGAARRGSSLADRRRQRAGHQARRRKSPHHSGRRAGPPEPAR